MLRGEGAMLSDRLAVVVPSREGGISGVDGRESGVPSECWKSV